MAKLRPTPDMDGSFGTWRVPRLPAAWSGLDLPREWQLRRSVASARGGMGALCSTLSALCVAFAARPVLDGIMGQFFATAVCVLVVACAWALSVRRWCSVMDRCYAAWLRELSVRAVPASGRTSEDRPPSAGFLSQDEIALALAAYHRDACRARDERALEVTTRTWAGRMHMALVRGDDGWERQCH